MSLRSRVSKGVLAVAMTVPSVAYADTDGTAGTVASVTVNESGSDDYSTVRGELVINEGQANRTYKWGGTVCSGRNVSETNVALLFEALRARDSVQLVPSYKSGIGGARCLVGFKLEPVRPPSSAG